MFCTTAGVSGAHEPVVLYSACEPGALGIASSRDDHGEARYADGPLVDADCLSYKTYRDREADGGAQREYPLLLAWRIAPVLTDGPTRWGRLARFAGVLVLIGAAGAAYVSLKRRIRASAPARRALAGGKRRDEGAVAPEDESPGDVDPKLRKAAEEYLQERQEGDGADGTG
jgi:hypothetical protein